MHITGIIDNESSQEVLETIEYFMNATGRKITVTDYESRFRNSDIWNDYCSVLNQIGTEILLLKIKLIYLDEVIKELPLDTIIVSDTAQWDKISSQIRHENNTKRKKMLIILNSDIIKPTNFSDKEIYKVLCYGFNSDSDITASSTGEPYSSGQFLCCVRDGIVTASGSSIESQEFAMNLDSITYNPVNTTELKYAGYSVFSHITQEKAL